MRKATDIVFHISLGVKGVDALFEVAGGILLSMPTKLSRYITLLAEHEAFRHHEALAGKLGNMAMAVTMHPSMLEAWYLVLHGLAKVVLISAIFANKRWGYTGLFWILGIFSIAEIVRACTAHEVVTAALAAFDIVIVVLIFKEYRERFGSKSNAPVKPLVA